MKYPVLLMETAQKLAQQDEKEEKGSLLTDKDKRKLARYMQKLGFEDVGASFFGLHAGSKERVGNVFCTLPSLPNSKTFCPYLIFLPYLKDTTLPRAIFSWVCHGLHWDFEWLRYCVLAPIIEVVGFSGREATQIRPVRPLI